ncbi:hypothetical protein ANTQUA_LOCUS3463 [Anthophora quadrimaculata]
MAYSTWYCRRNIALPVFPVVIALRIELRMLYPSSIVLVTRYATDTCFRLDAFENQHSTTVAYSTWYCRQSTSIQVFSIVMVLRIVLRRLYPSSIVVVARYASDMCIRLDAFENQHSTTVAYSTWYCRRNTALPVFPVEIALRIELRMLYPSSIVLVTRYATDTCFRLDAFENQHSTTVAYSIWYCRQTTSIQVFSIVMVLRIVLRLLYPSSIVVVERYASDMCFRLDAFENQHSTTVAYSTWYCRRNTALPVFPVEIALRIELRMLYPSSIVLVTRYATDTCFRLDAFEYQHSTTVAYSTWHCKRNTTLQVIPVVIALRIVLRLLYLSSIVVVARYATDTCFRLDEFEYQDSTTVAYSTGTVVAAICATDTCFRLDAFENQDSTTVAYSTWYCRRNTALPVFPVVIALRIELRMLYTSSIVLVTRYATDTCFRLDAFEYQHSTTVAYSTWHCKRNTTLPVIPVVIALRIVLRLLYLSSIVVVARYATDTCFRLDEFEYQDSTTVAYSTGTVVAAICATDTCFRLDAFENQDSTTVAYSTWYCRRNTALPVFPVVIALRIELRMLYTSSIVLVTRYATDTCFRLDVFENQDSTTVDFSTWYCRRNTALPVFPVVIVLRIELRLLYPSSIVVVARYASDTCFRLDAFENQHSTTVAYSTWYCRQRTSIQVFSIVMVLRIVLRLLYPSSIVVVERYASDMCIRLEAFENQHSTTVAYSTWYCRRNTALPVFPVVIALRIELRMLYPSSIVLVTRYATDTFFRLDELEYQDSTTEAYSTWYCRRNTALPVFPVVIALRLELRLLYPSSIVVVTRYATDTFFRLDEFVYQDSTTEAYSTWYYRRNTALPVFPVVIALRLELQLLYTSSIVVVARYASNTCFRLEAFGNQDSSTVPYSTWYCTLNTSIQVFSIVIVLRIELRLLYLPRAVVVARYASNTCFRLDAFENQDSTTVVY